MQITPQAFPEVLLIEPRVFGDRRGHFLEIFQARRYQESGLPGAFVQDNVSFSVPGVVRALHYQLRFPQGKLIIPLTGEIWDVVVDVRRGSPTFGKHMSVTLTADPAASSMSLPGSPTALPRPTAGPRCCTSAPIFTTPRTSTASPGTTRTWPFPGR